MSTGCKAAAKPLAGADKPEWTPRLFPVCHPRRAVWDAIALKFYYNPQRHLRGGKQELESNLEQLRAALCWSQLRS